MLHEETKFYVDLNGETSDTFQNKRGFKEGSNDSTTKFTLLSVLIVRMFRSKMKGINIVYDADFKRGFHRQHKDGAPAAANVRILQLIEAMFADDTTLFSRRRDASHTDSQVDGVLQICGQDRNEDKQEFLRQRHASQPFSNGGDERNKKCVKIIGSMFCDDGNYAADMRERV